MAINKDTTFSVSISTITSLAAVLPILWFVGKPVLTTAVSDAMGEEIQETVKGEIAPVISAFEVLLTLQINELRKEIAAMRFRQRRGGDEWTQDDADILAEAEIELESLRDALEALQNTA